MILARLVDHVGKLSQTLRLSYGPKRQVKQDPLTAYGALMASRCQNNIASAVGC